MTGSILVVDDEPELSQALSRLLSRHGFQTLTAHNGEEALEVLRSEQIPLVLSDLMMPRMNGVELLKAAKVVSPATEMVIVTGHGTIETAVEAMKMGAYDFIEKPFTASTALKVVRKALEKQQLMAENIELRRMLKEGGGKETIVGRSEVMRQTLETARQVAQSRATVLLTGESGTGKEVFANAIHRWSDRAGKPLIKLSCAAIPETLLEAELFGYEKGAFTGAVNRRQGRFEAAHGGTLFLDEVGEMPLTVQVKLLRVIQEGVFERLGSNTPIEVNVRLMAATNADLEQMVSEGTFREDLYYRLNVVPMRVPPLRERPEDVLPLAEHFLTLFNMQFSKHIAGFTDDGAAALEAYPWPGNIREIRNVVERAVLLGDESELGAAALALTPSAGGRTPPSPARSEFEVPGWSDDGVDLEGIVEGIEEALVRRAYEAAGGNKSLAARLLGLNRDKFRTRFDKYDIS
jgi:two-component system response regulator HydG